MVKVRPHKGDRLRRPLNVVAAAVLIVMTAPIMLVIALLVRLTSRGPVIYKQKRVGLDRRVDRAGSKLNPKRNQDMGGRIFTMYKFRTMYHQEEGAEKQVWATENDPRVTPVGRFLRAFRLDEFPQLFNVLLGDMNIVGPRPEQPEIFQDIREELGNYERRQQVLPGITGLAQVSLSYDSDLEDVRKKVELDLQYLRKRSASEDLRIMLKTMPVMVGRKGSR
ncbi:MAG: sugar transferase [Gemmatimonadetes bacterium]|nr:sugar transferase [Gemmatimonadota bacterium]